MRGTGKFITGLLVGLGAAFLLDPDRGARRRGLVRDKATHTSRKLAEGIDAKTRDLRNRARGAAAELRARLRRDEVSDEILHERVRSALGRVVSHPAAVSATVQEGVVTLKGPVLEHELEPVLEAARQVRGVADVVNELEVHPEAGAVSAQGEGRRPT